MPTTSGRFGGFNVMSPQTRFLGHAFWGHRINIMLYMYFFTWLHLTWTARNLTQPLRLPTETQFNCRALIRENRCVLFEAEANLYTIKEHSCLLYECNVHIITRRITVKCSTHAVRTSDVSVYRFGEYFTTLCGNFDLSPVATNGRWLSIILRYEGAFAWIPRETMKISDVISGRVRIREDLV